MKDAVKDIDYDSVVVIMATYNAKPYIVEQIDSILCQIGNSRLVIHDDGSTDGTDKILLEYSKADHRVEIIQSPPTGGAKENFCYLMGQVDCEYLFFADQDDIWQPNKFSVIMNEIRKSESQYGKDMPILVHTDAILIDGTGNLISDSMWKYQKMSKKWSQRLGLLMTQNIVTGCTMAINQSLMKLVATIPDGAEMHDSWIALVCCKYGKIISLEEPLTRYRQHSKNVVGTQKNSAYYYADRVQKMIKDYSLKGRAYNEDSRKRYIQAKEFCDVYSLNGDTKVSSFYMMSDMSYIPRIFTILKYGYFRSDVISNLSWILQPRILAAPFLFLINSKNAKHGRK
ncbi:glycosyltransferase family 2 protein [Deinococcus aquaticus]|uniref:Glycosyltransferase family 2 protein n=1 Tax=Deinococcus aquaticus TaxID=328692 RepID=A0ABY7V3G9_9DEIO|nr:glycosyltransferase family 2 protein [Deinococcus aquaticus]WDA59270.1 glycosyltransferase family 2 protein [Deinococcus aquaticus]